MTITNAVAAWSYSRYDTYQLCPLKFKLRVIDKLKEPQSPVMARGDGVHKQVAAFIMSKPGELPLPPDVKYPFQAKLLRELQAFEDKVVEQQWGFTRQWEPTGWFSKDTWYRQILDVAVLYEDMHAEDIDWKTGKRYGSNDDQMELQALSLMRHFKPATGVTTRLVYLDHGMEETAEFVKADEPKLLAKWEKKIEPMFADTQFLPRPNDKCKWCAFSASNQGQCRFG